MIMTINTDQLRATHTNFPRLLDGENRSKFIAAVRSPLARDLLNSNVRAQLAANHHIIPNTYQYDLLL